ncbi:pyridoxamine 5'-phosphate oxidase family protein [Variovorax sp. J22R133]|uniref:pyridoxamine 5'-phosphate oxidase family protein n=1 Tax=Variovorax brevis TaxID=3053503 RepID=UPI0025788D82|nr:pyridoxamine 5'-phosphate oxidase family protein [Variovorax sp. J22R133]MDM0115804.1 pyridoxamine 5'-phosphate oxidase family protein [Variovorax sp. J22R133]
MSDLTLQELSKKIADIDFTMLTTRTEDDQIAGRPMSNNGDVEFDGDSCFFAWATSRVAKDIAREPKAALMLQGKAGLLGKPPLMISMQGDAELIRDKAQFAAHWQKELDRWFTEGVDTPGVVMIKFHARRIHYWDGEDEGEFLVNGQQS